MIIYVDIDETICYYEKDRDYRTAIPYKNRIKKINQLYDEGNKIVYWTARGTVTKIDWYDITKKQLLDWDCKYHELSVGNKPNYDLLICDKAVNTEKYFRSVDDDTGVKRDSKRNT